jgi:nucleoside-diphosphate-sugar epimerase
VKNILVIGGGGYVGSQLVPRLVSEGFFVTVLDTFWYGTKHLRDSASIKLVEADMRMLIQYKVRLLGKML